MNVQNAAPLGVKLYIIVSIVIFKKLGGITITKANLDPNTEKLQYNYTLTFNVLHNIANIFFISLYKSNSIPFCYFLNYCLV